MKYNKIFTYLLVLLFPSCEMTKELDYDTIYERDKIIVHGFISPQNGVELMVKKSVSPNMVLSDDKISDAVVALCEDGTELFLLNRLDDYLFKSDDDFNPAFGKIYSVTVRANSFDETSSAEQVIVATVVIDSLQLISEENTNYKNLVVSFTNKAQNDGAFYLKIYYCSNGTIDSSYLGYEFFNPYGLIDNVVVGRNSIERPLYGQFDSLIVELYTLSPDLVEFLKSFQNYDFSKEDPFFEQTYPVFSNIENGYGLFASYSVCSKTILNNNK